MPHAHLYLAAGVTVDRASLRKSLLEKNLNLEKPKKVIIFNDSLAVADK